MKTKLIIAANLAFPAYMAVTGDWRGLAFYAASFVFFSVVLLAGVGLLELVAHVRRLRRGRRDAERRARERSEYLSMYRDPCATRRMYEWAPQDKWN